MMSSTDSVKEPKKNTQKQEQNGFDGNKKQLSNNKNQFSKNSTTSTTNNNTWLSNLSIPTFSLQSKTPTKQKNDETIGTIAPTTTPSKTSSAIISDISKNVHDFTTTLRTRSSTFANELFGEPVVLKSNTRPTGHSHIDDNHQVDIFSASVTDVLKDIGKQFIQPVVNRRKSANDIQSNLNSIPSSKSTPITKNSNVTSNRKSVSEYLEIDGNDCESISTYHLKLSTVLDEDLDLDTANSSPMVSTQSTPIKGVFINNTPLKPTMNVVEKDKIVLSTKNVREKQKSPQTTSYTTTTHEFMSSITDLPDELLDVQDSNPIKTLFKDENEHNSTKSTKVAEEEDDNYV